MSLTAHISSTKSGSAVAELWDHPEDISKNPTLVAKMYGNADGTKVRIMLPELVNYKQTLVDPDSHWLEFSRDPDSSLPNAHRAPVAAARVKCSVLGCERLASFVVHKIAYCQQHKSVAKERS